MTAAFALLTRRLSAEYRARFEEALGLTPTYLQLGVLAGLPRREALRSLRSFRGARCFLPLEHEEDAPLLPLLETAALVSGAAATEVVHPDLRRARRCRRQALLSARALAAAGLEGRLARRRCRRELDGLLDRPRLDVRPASRHRALLLYSDLWLRPGAGARIARLAGIADALAATGYEVDVATCVGSLPVGSSVELHRLRTPAALATPYEVNAYRLHSRVVRQLGGLVADRRPALLFERKTRGSYAGVVLSRQLGIPLVLEYGVPAAWQAEDYGVRLGDEELAGRAELACLRHAHVVLTAFESLRNELLERGVPPERIVLHPVGVDPSLFDPGRFAKGDRLQVRAELGIPADSVVVTFSGSFRQVHGVELLAGAVRRLADEDVEWLSRHRLHFLLVGDGPTLADVRRHLAELRFVTFSGLVPLNRIPGYLAASDVLLAPFLPSAVGLSPAKLFEYMAMGKPIVASDLDQVGRVLRPALAAPSLPTGSPKSDERRLGLLVRPGDVDDLVAAIRFLAERADWRAALGGRVRAEVLARYTHRHQVEAVLVRLAELGRG